MAETETMMSLAGEVQTLADNGQRKLTDDPDVWFQMDEQNRR